MSTFVPEKQVQLRGVGQRLRQHVSTYFRDKNHRREFESWYEERYGKPYRWERVKVKPPSA